MEGETPSVQPGWNYRVAGRKALELFYNRVITHVPFNPLRLWWLRMLGAELGDHVYLFGGSEVVAPELLKIAGNCHVGRFCQLDARGRLTFGRNVVVANHTLIITADHDPANPDFAGRVGAVTLEDRVWVGSRATILKGVTLGEGAVVAAGAVVVSDIPPWSIAAGVPAKVIGSRPSEQRYTIDFGPTWF